MTTTGDMQLFQPQASDFVDVNRDVNNQMAVIDSFASSVLQYRTTSQSWSNLVSETVVGARRFSTWDNSIRNYVPGPPDLTTTSQWRITRASQSPWTNFSTGFLPPSFTGYQSGYVPDPANPVRYRRLYIDNNVSGAQVHLQFRGRIILTTGYTALPSNTNNKIIDLTAAMWGFSTSQLDTDQTMNITCGRGGLSSNNHYQYNRVSLHSADAGLYIARYPTGTDTAVQTNGDTKNYYCLDGYQIRINI